MLRGYLVFSWGSWGCREVLDDESGPVAGVVDHLDILADWNREGVELDALLLLSFLVALTGGYLWQDFDLANLIFRVAFV